MKPSRMKSWSANEAERDNRIKHAQAIVGSAIVAVRYLNIDYRREELGLEIVGPRIITAPKEWEAPTWQFEACDSLDYGVELDTDQDKTFSVTWDPPGWTEGISIDEGALLGERPFSDSNLAIWDVTHRPGWSSLLGATIAGIDLHYEPWDESGAWWSRRISLHLPLGRVGLCLGEARPDGTIGPSSDEVAVLLPRNGFPREAPSLGGW